MLQVHPANLNIHRSQQGNTLIEYVLIGVLVVVVVSLVGLQVTGGKLNGLFGLYKDGANNQTIMASAADAARSTAMMAFVSKPDMQMKVPPTPPAAPALPPTVPTGTIDETPYSTSLSGKVQTTGVNGATMEMASQLQALAEQLAGQNALPQAEIDKILALANQGYRMAALEKQIEDASNSVSTNADFLNSTITFDGTTMTMQQAADLIGFSSPNAPIADITSNSNYMLETATAQPETMSFLNLYNDVMNSPGVQGNPDLSGIVSQLSSQISYLSDSTSNLVYGAMKPAVTLTDLHNSTASEVTTYDSTSICHLSTGCGT